MSDCGFISTLAGGAVAIVSAALTGFFTRRAERNAARQSLMGAFSGEVSAILAVVEDREYVSGIQQTLADTVRMRTVRIFPAPITKNYFRVYEANAEKLGVLEDPLPEKLARFYTQCNALLEDVGEMRAENWAKLEWEESARRLAKMLALWSQTEKVAKEALAFIATRRDEF